MKNNASLVYSVLLIIGDFLALLAAFIAAYILRVRFDPRPLIEQVSPQSFIYAVIVVLPLWLLAHGFIGLYSQEVFEKRFAEFGRLLVGSFLGILVVIGYDYVTNGHMFPARLVPVYGVIFGFGFLFLFRSAARNIRKTLYGYGLGISNILIIGDTRASENIALILSDTRKSGQRVLGVVGHHNPNFPFYASFSEAIEKIKEPIHGIVQTELYKDEGKNNEILRYTQQHHAAYRFVPGNSDLFVGNLAVELFAGLPVVAVHQTALVGWGRILKRLFDIAATLVLGMVVFPLILLIAIVLKLVYPRSDVFFRQTRLTRFNRKFQVYKFRTVQDKYNHLTPEKAFMAMGQPELVKEYRDNGDFLPDDPRFTAIGRFLRRTSLDELPQFINVLKGDISLVGPRALIPQELAAYEKRHAILSVKSGLTGLAQISGRRDISFDERRQLDMYYVQNWSFWLDLIILLKTLRVVLSGNGAK